ncbi:MAG: hypothetical protein ABSC56_02815 [Solirubrobacteraceae bacterium]
MSARRLECLLAALCATVAAAAGLAGSGAPASATTPRQATVTPAALGNALQTLAGTIAVQWAAHELPDGALIDPVIGPLAGDYGDSMTGQAMVVAGIASQDQSLIASGLDAELADVAHPDDGGFELLGLSEAYAIDEQELGSNPAWLAAAPRIARFLRRHRRSISDQGICYTSPHCYTNLKLVSAIADLSLLHTGLRSGRKGALLANAGALRAQSMAWLAMAARNTGSDAYRVGQPTLSGMGILSDPSENPLAYHALSTLLLGKAILMLGPAAPPATRAAFGRTARALVALLAPDGNDTYIGRGQAQVWTVGVTIDALATAAELTADPNWRGRYLAAAQVSLERLETLYPSSGWGLPLVPRFANVGDPHSYAGIDHYANTVEYNGLALWALDGAVTALENVQPADPEPLPSTSDGVFVDPSHTQFAAVTHGNLWFAIHALETNPDDPRYGFGLVAAELDGPNGWQAVLPAPPLTTAATVGTLALRSKRGLLYPIGRHITADASSGTVTIRGGWGSGQDSKKLTDAGSVWSYAPTGNGATLSYAGPAGSTYELQVWYEAGAQVSRAASMVTIEEPDGTTQTYSLNAPIGVRRGAQASSAYAASLRSLVLVVTPKSGFLQYTTGFAAAPASGATGVSGATASSGTSGTSGASGSSGPSSSSGAS